MFIADSTLGNTRAEGWWLLGNILFELAVTSSVSVDQIIGIYSQISFAFSITVYNRKVPMFYTTLLEGMMQFFTCSLQLLKKKVLCLWWGIESFMLYKIVTAAAVRLDHYQMDIWNPFISEGWLTHEQNKI